MTVSRNLSPSNLAYPNISFTETIAGPLPIRFGFRNTIGIAATFNRGPEGPTLITNRNTAVYLFGEDDSPGSLFLQQGMYQGATRFVVSRVVPTARPSTATIPLQKSSNPFTSEAFVANSVTRRTVGLTFTASYVTPPIRTLGTFATEPVEVKPESTVKLDLQGAGVLQFTVKELLQATGALSSGTTAAFVSGKNMVEVTNLTDLQLLSFSRDSEPILEAFARPGRLLAFQATAASALIKQRNAFITQTVSQQELTGGVTANAIHLANNTITFGSDSTTPVASVFVTGDAVTLASSGTLPVSTPAVTASGTYYVRLVSANVISLHPTSADATANTNIIDITAVGSGTLTLTRASGPDAIDPAGYIQLPAVTAFRTGQLVYATSSGTLPTGLSDRTPYWLRVLPNNVVTLHRTYEGATGLNVTLDMVSYPSLGTGNLTLTVNVAKVTQQALGGAVTGDCIDTTADKIYFGTANDTPILSPFATGDKVRVTSSGTLPTGLTAGTDYFLRVDTTGYGVTLHTTLADAKTGASPVNISAVGSGITTFTLQAPVFSAAIDGAETNNRLEVMSYYFMYQGMPTIVVRGKTAPHSSAFGVTFVEPTSLGNTPYYAFQLAFAPTQSLLPSDLYPAAQGPNGEFVNVFRLFRKDRNWQKIYVYGPHASGNDRLRVLNDTGVELRFGDPSATDNLDFIPEDQFGIGVTRGSVTIGQYVVPGTETSTLVDGLRAFPPGYPVTEIVEDLAKAIRGSTPLDGFLGDVSTNTLTLPYSFTFVSSFAGVDANRIEYQIDRHWVASPAVPSDPMDVVLGAMDSYNGLAQRTIDGADPMLYASRYIYDANGRPIILIKALSPGAQGNNIRIGIRPVPPGQWRLEVYDDTNQARVKPLPAESYLMSNYSVDPQTGEFRELLDSRMVRAYFLPIVNSNGLPIDNQVYDLTPQRLAPPIDDVTDTLDPKHISHRGISFLRTIYLEGGADPLDYDPALPQERDMIDAIRRLEQEDIAILALPGVTVQDARYEAAVSEIVAQSERSSTINGLRITVLQAPPNVTSTRAQTISDSVLRSDRVVIHSGHITMAGYRYLGINRVPADGYYCGTLAMIQPHYSPAAVSVTPPLNGVVTNDTVGTPDNLDALTRAGLEALHFDPGLRQHKFLNGITSSNDPNKRYVSVRRMADQMVMDLVAALVWVRSMPHTAELRKLVSSSVDAYLRQLLRDQKIYAYRPTICDESNNTPLDQSQGRMNVKITYTPVFPADFIRLDIIRDLNAEFAITTAAGA